MLPKFGAEKPGMAEDNDANDAPLAKPLRIPFAEVKPICHGLTPGVTWSAQGTPNCVVGTTPAGWS